MSDEILIKEQWAKNGIPEHWVRVEDYVALQAKLADTEKKRMQAACDRNTAQYKLAIAIDAIRQTCSNYAVPDYERSVLKEALTKISLKGDKTDLSLNRDKLYDDDDNVGDYV